MFVNGSTAMEGLSGFGALGWDCVSDSAYLLNTKYLKLKIQGGLNFAKTPFKEPTNQLAKVAFVVVGVQLMTNNRRRQGLLYNIT